MRCIATAFFFAFLPAGAGFAQQPAEPDPQSQPQEPIEIKEEVVVSATRTETRLQDQPLRVEVIDREDIEEKALMTPGSVAMLLSETSGLRVQTTAPSLGAANVRIQGLRGRYAQRSRGARAQERRSERPGGNICRDGRTLQEGA